jgi:hypothetical protein
VTGYSRKIEACFSNLTDLDEDAELGIGNSDVEKNSFPIYACWLCDTFSKKSLFEHCCRRARARTIHGNRCSGVILYVGLCARRCVYSRETSALLSRINETDFDFTGIW